MELGFRNLKIDEDAFKKSFKMNLLALIEEETKYMLRNTSKNLLETYRQSIGHFSYDAEVQRFCEMVDHFAGKRIPKMTRDEV